MSRTLSQGEDGEWMEYALWRDMDAALAAAAAFPEQDFMPELMAAFLPESMAMSHHTVAWQMSA